MDVEGKFRPNKVSFDPKLTIWTMQQMSKEIIFFLTLHDYKKYLFRKNSNLSKHCGNKGLIIFLTWLGAAQMLSLASVWSSWSVPKYK